MAPKKKAGGEANDDRLHVVVRIRPPVRQDEKFGEGSEALQVDKERNIMWLLQKDEAGGGGKTKQYAFDRVLWKDSQQIDAWEAAGVPVVKGAMEGYTGCVMCYGQTGAGKSYTLANNKPGQEGIMVQSFNYLFTAMAEERELKYDIKMAYVQIYLDGITDLLNPKNDIDIREDPKDGVYVAGVTWSPVTTTKEALTVLDKGNGNRATAATKMNADSSRSHAALMLSITCTGGPRTLMGKLFLVDLAGSERIKKSGVEGAALDEAKAINLSLTTLGRCIEILSSGKKEKPPFRESKLTRLLSNAIGGAAKTTLIVCVAPTVSDVFETTNSLEFGLQAMKVETKAKINASTDYNSLTSSLMTQRAAKQTPLFELEASVLRELQPSLDEVCRLEMEFKDILLVKDMMEERVIEQEKAVKELKKQAVAEAERDEMAMVELLNQRSKARTDLEKVLLSLSDNPEIKSIQEEHEKEKNLTSKRALELQELLQTAELKAPHEQSALDATLEGAIHTARNLGQIAAYFFQTGAANEAADFYMQAKGIFEAVLGDTHPKTQQWQQDLFFLINAPAIQRITAAAAADQGDPEMTAQDWWMQNLPANIQILPGNTQTTPRGGDGADDWADGWWMQNLFDMKTRDQSAQPDEEASYIQAIFATPRGDANIFTPRGTFSGLQGLQSGLPPVTQKQDVTFTADWVQSAFEGGNNTRRVNSSEEIDQKMVEANEWLMTAFGTPRETNVPPPSLLPKPSSTPRDSAQGRQSDDLVLAAAMQAAISTPRTQATSTVVDDRAMASAANKIFHNTPENTKSSHKFANGWAAQKL